MKSVQLTVLVNKTLPCSWLTQILLFLILLLSKPVLFFQYLLLFLSSFLSFLADVFETLNVKQNILPGETLIKYFLKLRLPLYHTIFQIGYGFRISAYSLYAEHQYSQHLTETVLSLWNRITCYEDRQTGLKCDPRQGLKPEQVAQWMHFIPGITDNPVVAVVKAALSNRRAA